MVILQGSSAPLQVSRRVDKKLLEKRDLLLAQGILIKENDRCIFQRDYLFKTPSGASGLLLLGSSNGWQDWKTKQAVSLHDYIGRKK